MAHASFVFANHAKNDSRWSGTEKKPFSWCECDPDSLRSLSGVQMCFGEWSQTWNLDGQRMLCHWTGGCVEVAHVKEVW